MTCIVVSTFKNDNLISRIGIVDFISRDEKTKLSIKVKREKIFYDDKDDEYDTFYYQV
jgi:hypothetical protein